MMASTAFVLGAILGGMVGVCVMCLMFMAKQCDQSQGDGP